MPNASLIKHLLFVPCLLLAFISHYSLALKPEHEAKRLLLAAEQSLEKKDFSAAEQHLIKAKNLGTALPAEYHYYRAKILLHGKQSSEARRLLEGYVDKVGEKGKFYEDALKSITLINKQNGRKKIAKPHSTKAKINWSDPSQKGKDYVDNLQTLYMTDSPIKALTIHINNLLNFYAYADKRIKASSRLKQAVRHSIRVNKRGEIVSTNQSMPMDQKQSVTEDRFPVFGINPYIDSRCSNSSSSCWTIHPITSQIWLRIVQNKDAATELSKALTQLIKQMQKS